MHPVAGDTDAVSAAQVSRTGQYLLYLNATPQQGTETLANWAAFRVQRLASDDASRATLNAAIRGQPFRGGAGSCVIDHYVTRIRAHRFTELACLVRGRSGATVIVAAAPISRWASAQPMLDRAVSAYLAR